MSALLCESSSGSSSRHRLSFKSSFNSEIAAVNSHSLVSNISLVSLYILSYDGKFSVVAFSIISYDTLS